VIRRIRERLIGKPMRDWATVTYADLTAGERWRVDDARAYVRSRALADAADELHAERDRAEEIVDGLIARGHLADQMAGLRWIASTLNAQPQA
jgi:hypothetical protein